MYAPKRTKFRKHQKGRIYGQKSNTQSLCFGQFGIKALAPARIPSRNIEAVRRILSRKFKRVGQIWIRIFPDICVSGKPAEVRMGKGKGSPLFWICRIQSGQILFEMDGISPQLARQAYHSAYYKFPCATALVTGD